MSQPDYSLYDKPFESWLKEVREMVLDENSSLYEFFTKLESEGFSPHDDFGQFTAEEYAEIISNPNHPNYYGNKKT